jgi:hypothetical protein
VEDDTYRVALVKAAVLLGGARALSDRLRVPMPELTHWLAGDGKPPMGVFLRVVDILIEERDKPQFLPDPSSNDSSGKPSGSE